jgi:hypothetical protein
MLVFRLTESLIFLRPARSALPAFVNATVITRVPAATVRVVFLRPGPVIVTVPARDVLMVTAIPLVVTLNFSISTDALASPAVAVV